MPSRMLRLGSPGRHIPWSVFQNVRRNTGSPRFLLEGRPSVVSRGAFRAPSLYRQLISGPFHPPSEGAFQRSLTLLVRYRSRGVFSLGRRCLPYSRGISNPRYSGTGARRTGPRYGAVTLYRALFQGTSRGRSDVGSQPEHHIARRLRFGLGRFHSPLLTTSRLASLPAGTEMFQFPAFPIAQGNCRRIPIRKSPVLPLRAGPRGLSQLGTSFIGTRAEPFTSWHSSHVYSASDPVIGSSRRLDCAYIRPSSYVGRTLTLPIHPSSGDSASVVDGRKPAFPIRDAVPPDTWTHWDSNPGHPPCKGGTLPLSYGPTSGWRV